MSDAGGDPACWADRVCPVCGMLDERKRRDGLCPHCDARADEQLETASPEDTDESSETP
jgi:NMD protein affecting ribosome stability and mRNA decay